MWPATEQRMTQKCYSNCLLWTVPVHWMRQGQAPWHTNTHTWQNQKNWNAPVAWISVDTEAGMLSGISRKRSIRSNPYWFTEFCNSQCLSHFAAPFIVVRAETSVAESCVWCNEVVNHPEQYTDTCAFQQITVASQQRKTVQCWSTTRELVHEEADAIPNHVQKLINGSSQWNGWIRVNDPSAGSPTETLLRLLLPLSDKVH